VENERAGDDYVTRDPEDSGAIDAAMVEAWLGRLGSCEVAVLSFAPAALALPPSLTAAEREVAALSALGKSNVAIAAARRTSVRTTANQLASIFRKCGVSSRSELIALLAVPERRA
jgi:DNA-binding CsgD family transcriptional regulator